MTRKAKDPVPTKVPVPTCNWTHEMDDVLIDEYVHQETIGNRIDKTYTPRSLDYIVKVLKDKFPDKPIDRDKIQNRMKTIKKKFNRCYDIFKNGMSGFSWNPTQEMWDAEPEVWQKLIEANPCASQWKNTRIRNYEKLVSLYGQDRATGEHAECGADLRRKRVRDAESTTTIDEDEVSFDNSIDTMGDNENVSVQDNVGVRVEESFENPTSSRSKKAKKAKIDEGTITNVMETVAGAIKVMAKSSEDLVNIFKPKDIHKDVDLWKYIENIGIDQHLQYVAYTYLLDNPQRFDSLNATPIEHRKNLLLLWIGQ